MGDGWSPFDIIATAIAAVMTVVGTIATMGVLTGVLIGIGTLMLASTIEGIATGRMFSSVSAFLFEPTRLICKILGIEDKTLVQGRMLVCKVFHENQWKPTLTKNCITRSKDGSGLLQYFYGFAKVGTAQFDKYYYTGKKRFIDALPDCNVASSTISLDDIKTVVSQDVGREVNIGHVILGYPDEFTWIQWLYQEQDKFNYSTNQFKFNDRYYTLYDAEYNLTTDKIDAVFRAKDDATVTIDQHIDFPDLTSYYIVIYTYADGDKQSRLWVHPTNVDDIKADFMNEDVGKMIKGNIDCLPIVCLRSNRIDVKDARDRGDVPESFRNPKRYKQSKKLLLSLGIRIDDLTEQYHKNGDIDKVYDAYFMAGICPKQTIDDKDKDPKGNENSVEAVAKYMYRVVNKIYEFLPCGQSGQPYFMTFFESPLRGQICWAGVPPIEVRGRKCKPKHYTMELDYLAKEHYKVVVQILDSYLGKRTIRRATSYDSDGYASTYREYTIYEYSAKYVMLEIDAQPITPQKIIDNMENAVPFFPNRTVSYIYGKVVSSKMEESSNKTLMRGSEDVQFPAIAQFDHKLEDDPPCYYVLRSVQRDEEVMSPSGDPVVQVVTDYLYENLLTKEPDEELPYLEYSSPYTEPKSLTLYYQKNSEEYKQVILRNAISVYATDNVDEGLLDAVGVDSKNFIFPISYQALKALSVYDKTKLISESFQLVFFAKEITHLAFYETPEFGTFLQVVGIIITVVVTIFTWGSQTVTVQAAIQSLIQIAAVYIGVTLALQIIAEYVVDSTLKAILSAAVMVAAIYFGGGFSEFNFSTAVHLAEIPVKAIDIYTKDQMKYVQQDMIDLQNRYKDAQEAIDKATGQLNKRLSTQDVIATQALTREWGGRLMSNDELVMLTITCPDLYSVCQDQIDFSKTTDLDVQYPLYDM